MAGLIYAAFGFLSGLCNGLVQFLSLSVSLVLICLACVGIHRVFFSSISSVPGPKLAALTYLYEGYYEVWLGGKYFLHIAELHRQYGPIVRITPHEVHFADPEFLDPLYPVSGRRTDKPPVYARITGTPHSIVSTISHEQHRQRRSALSSFFSTVSVHKFEPTMKAHIKKMMVRLDSSACTKSVVNIHNIFNATTSDIITHYAFGKSFNYLDMPDYGQAYFEATRQFLLLTHICVLIPWVYPVIQSSPGWLLRIMLPALREIRDRQDWWMSQIDILRRSSDLQAITDTIFGGILTSKLPPEEKTNTRMANEAQLVIIAGEGTTAWSLHAALFEILEHPEVFYKLKAELSQLELDQDGLPSIQQLEGLPYLGAVIQEAVRVHPGVLTRQMRVSPELPIIYEDTNLRKKYTVPSGFVVSMSPYITHRDEHIFQDAKYFDPERWIKNPKLTRYFHGFSRGTRSCVGMTLARCEMALVLASIILKYDIDASRDGPSMQLFDTKRERDVNADSDYIIPNLHPLSLGVRVQFSA